MFKALSFFSWLVIVVLLNIQNKITFGHGLGGLFYLISLVVISVFVLVIWMLTVSRGSITRAENIFYSTVMWVIIIATMLKLTFFRGPERPWNGDLFY